MTHLSGYQAFFLFSEDDNFFLPRYRIICRSETAFSVSTTAFLSFVFRSAPEEAEKVESVLPILSLEASVCPEERFDAAGINFRQNNG